VYSNGIIALAVVAGLLVIAARAKVDRLIPLYALGVFTSFTLSQAGMAKHHLRLREPGWRKGLIINGTGAVLTTVVDIVIVLTKFTHGAWAVCVAVPILVGLLVRTHHVYEEERRQLSVSLDELAVGPAPRHRVIVLVNELDRAALAALRYARTIRPISAVALHVAVDPERARDLQDRWIAAGVPIPLEVIGAPDRDLIGAVERYVAELSSEPGTEVTVLIPSRRYQRPSHLVLHDLTSWRLARRLSRLSSVNVTIVPFPLR
jgi:hypothetical protein